MKKVAVLFSLLVCVLLLASCYPAGSLSGGGWIYSAPGPEESSAKPAKATFGFQVVCGGEDNVTGEVQYNDHGTNVQFHATGLALPSWEWYCQEGWPQGCYEGTYYPQPKGASGSVEMCVWDNGLNGQDKADWISITLTGGAFDGYFNQGVLQGGNITAN